jgi:hypothetical protein
MNPLKLLTFSTLLLTLAACSSGGGSTTSGSNGSTSTGGGAVEPYTGYVIFGLSALAGTSEYDGQAGFYATVSGGSCPGGTVQGSCCYESAAAEAAYAKMVTADDVSAGAITLQDGARSLGSLPFTAGKGYTPINSLTTAAVTWAPGDSLGVSAAGDASGVASFSGTVVAPAPLAGVTPALASGLTLARSSDFNLTWTANSGGTVLLSIIASAGATSDGLIRCTATGSSGSLTVPTALLTNLKTGDMATLELSVSNNVPLSVANATVELTAEAYSLGSATLQ